MQSGESLVESQREASPSSQLGKSEELDKVFDILLFLLSIVTAVFFQYSSTIYPLRVAAFKPDLTKVEFFQEVDRFLRFDLRMYFYSSFLVDCGLGFQQIVSENKDCEKEGSFGILLCFRVCDNRV